MSNMPHRLNPWFPAVFSTPSRENTGLTRNRSTVPVFGLFSGNGFVWREKIEKTNAWDRKSCRTAPRPKVEKARGGAPPARTGAPAEPKVEGILREPPAGEKGTHAACAKDAGATLMIRRRESAPRLTVPEKTKSTAPAPATETAASQARLPVQDGQTLFRPLALAT